MGTIIVLWHCHPATAQDAPRPAKVLRAAERDGLPGLMSEAENESFLIRVVSRLIDAFVDDRRLLPFLRNLPAPPPPETRTFLGALVERSSDDEMRALATRALSTDLEADGGQETAPFVRSGPWIAKGGWHPADHEDRTVFFFGNGRTSVTWMRGWRVVGPSALRVHVPDVGSVDLELDMRSGRARVTSPENWKTRSLALRDHPIRAATRNKDTRAVHDCLVSTNWRWFWRGGPGRETAGPELRFRTDGATNVDRLPAWELSPSGQVRVYLEGGRYWAFDLDVEKKVALSNINDSQLKTSRAFAAGEAARVKPLVFTAHLPVYSGRLTLGAQWDEAQFPAAAGRYVCLEILSSHGGSPVSSAAEIQFRDEGGNLIDRAGWSVAYVSSEEHLRSRGAGRALDGKSRTFWHTQWIHTRPRHPHVLVIDLGAPMTIGGIRVMPRGEDSDGRIKDCRIYVSETMFPLATGQTQRERH